VSQRRVQQIIKQYKETGQETVLGEKVGRPSKPYDKNEAEIVRKAHARYRFGAWMLEPVIRKQYKICISHNRIHMYPKEQGLAQEDESAVDPGSAKASYKNGVLTLELDKKEMRKGKEIKVE
jgi:putative transposase